MKTIILFLCVIFTLQCFAQTVTVTKKLLYTLQPHEIISGTEAITSLKKNASSYCLVTYDTLSGKNTFIYNGQRVLTINASDFFSIETLDLNQNGFSLYYTKDEQEYLILNGETIGPYEELTLVHCEKTNEYGYFYKLGSKYYFKVNNEKYGPFSQRHSGILLTDTKRTFLGFYNWNKDVSAAVTGQKTFEMINSGGNLSILSNGKTIENANGVVKYALGSGNSYCYLSDFNDGFGNMQKNLILNGKIKGNHFSTDFKYDDFLFLNQSDYYYSKTESSGLKSIYKNDRIIYRNIKEIITHNENGNFLYKDVNGNFYANNNKILSNIVDYLYTPCIENENAYAFCYYQGDKTFVKSSKGEFGPYGNVFDLKMANGILSFSYTDENNIRNAYRDGKISLNDVNLNFYDVQENASFTYENHSFESSYEYNFVVINGESYGKSPALQAWIDPIEKKFYWTAIEKKEYVLYTYVFE
jgi:hypothetical protein